LAIGIIHKMMPIKTLSTKKRPEQARVIGITPTPYSSPASPQISAKSIQLELNLGISKIGRENWTPNEPIFKHSVKDFNDSTTFSDTPQTPEPYITQLDNNLQVLKRKNESMHRIKEILKEF
jgi:hypothetical protein